MNRHVSGSDLAAPKVTTGPISNSKKIYSTPEAAPEMRVPLREIALSASAAEPPLHVYDTSGPYTDPAAAISVQEGLPRTRTEWVRERGGVGEYAGRPVQAVDNGNVSGKYLAREF
ncbi:MAG: phosphomethylpyrimidine synthase, partial [Bradyrhizobiaceae bacterium]|nr:phosphomethylpyrimidine synthase [Bradyrhizobiaceae bacterium]